MSRRRYTPEQIIGMLREPEVGLALGEKVGLTSWAELHILQKHVNHQAIAIT